MKNKATNITTVTDTKPEFRKIQGMMRGEVTILMTTEAYEKLDVLHRSAQQAFDNSVTRGAIVDFAINTLWEEFHEGMSSAH